MLIVVIAPLPDTVESLMVFVIEILIGQIESIAGRCALHFLIIDNGIKGGVAGDGLIGRVFSIAAA